MMFERLTARAGRIARRRARARIETLARQLAAELPPGIRAEAREDGVRLSGRTLRRRFALDPALRSIIGGLLK